MNHCVIAAFDLEDDRLLYLCKEICMQQPSNHFINSFDESIFNIQNCS